MDNEAQLIIELKDAGFPIRELDGIHARVDPSTGKIIKTDTSQEIPPTLEELIEACGDSFFMLSRRHHDYYGATDGNSIQEIGSTPSEAVANLYIELNKK